MGCASVSRTGSLLPGTAHGAIYAAVHTPHLKQMLQAGVKMSRKPPNDSASTLAMTCGCPLSTMEYSLREFFYRSLSEEEPNCKTSSSIGSEMWKQHMRDNLAFGT